METESPVRRLLVETLRQTAEIDLSKPTLEWQACGVGPHRWTLGALDGTCTLLGAIEEQTPEQYQITLHDARTRTLLSTCAAHTLERAQEIGRALYELEKPFYGWGS